MPEISGTGGHDRIEGSAAGDLMTGGAGNDVYIVNHIDDVVVEVADEHVAGRLSWWATTADEPVTMVRTSASEFLIRVQIEGAADGIFAEFALRIVSEGVWGIQALRVGDAHGHLPTTTLSDNDSVWEYAFELGRPDPDGDPTQFEFYGGGHGFQQSQGFGVTLDGVDFSALPIGAPVNGLELGIIQDLDILLPSDGVTPAGSVLLQASSTAKA